MNMLRTRRLAWSDVVGIDMAVTGSWASFDLAEGAELPVLALQTVDGKRFRRAVAQVASLIDQHGAPGT